MSNKNRQDEILSEITSLIHQLDNTTRLNRIIDEVKQRRTSLGQQVKYKLVPGDKVLVNGNKIGKEEGTIERLNRTRAVVRIDETSWTVPFSMIEVI